MATYTDEQIQLVCDKAADAMKDFTVPQNCTFPSTAIIEGMKAGLTAEEIAINAYDSIKDLPLYQTGYGLVGTGNTMLNCASFMQGVIKKTIEEIDAAAPETVDEVAPEV